MSFSASTIGLPGSLQAAARGPLTRGRMAGSISGMQYPNPFFDIAGSYLPTSYKVLFRECRHFMLSTPIIPAVVHKLSEYPLTDVIFEHEDEGVKRRWEDLMFDRLSIRQHQVDAGIDYHLFGNNLTSVYYPFIKYLECGKCRAQFPAKESTPHWTCSGFEFHLTCPRCRHHGTARVRDVPVRDVGGIKILRYSPENVNLRYSEATASTKYYYDLPPQVRTELLTGKKDELSRIPQAFFEAMKEKKPLLFSPHNIYHMKRPTLPGQDRGWGIPLILPVLKDVFYLQLMKKAQEVIMQEHILPLRILFPQAGSGSSDPYTTVDLVRWKQHMAAEIARWRFDPNYIPLVPLPVGNQTLGGDGRALLVTPEIQEITRQIIAGMMVPQEFVFGGMSYAGTNVSMRMLENQFIGYLSQLRSQLRWLVQSIASFMDWPVPGVRFKPFKMADDLQRKQYLFQLNSAGKVSDTTLLADADLDQAVEDKLRDKELNQRLMSTKREQLAMAELQGEQQVIMAKAQAKAQQVQQEALQQPVAPGEPGGAEQTLQGGGTAGGQQAESGTPLPEALRAMTSPVSSQQAQQSAQQPQGSITQMAAMMAQQIAQMAPEDQAMALQNLELQSPELAQMVRELLAQQGIALGDPGGAPGVDMRPLPDQLPPRREAQLV